MTEKYIIDQHWSHLHGNNVSQTTWAEVEEKSLPITELDHYASRSLVVSGWPRRRAHEGDPHLIGAKLLCAGKVSV
jgi:hypothetical protein